jgi:hypothetical protein
MNIEKIREHYERAKAKHPYFCDKLLDDHREHWFRDELDVYRSVLWGQIDDGDVSAECVLGCETVEAFAALECGNTAAAVEECYDAIAVLLRVVDVLEGRQALGKPKEGGAE